MSQWLPALVGQFHLPTRSQLDPRLLSGALVFGLGWGLYGYCPGPALASLSTLAWQPILFVTAMIVGMKIAERI